MARSSLELENAEGLQARAMIGCHVIKLLEAQNMKQRELAEILGVKQVEISHLLIRSNLQYMIISSCLIRIIGFCFVVVRIDRFKAGTCR